MSASELNDLLNTPKLFLLLPAVNHTLLVATTSKSSEFLFAIAAIISSAVVYNILDGVPVEEADKVRIWTTSVFIAAGIGWIVTFVISLIRLREAFSQVVLIHEILFFGSIGFVCVVLSHLLLRLEDKYENNL